MIDLLCKQVISSLNINKFVETGTFQGETLAQVSIWFSKLHPEFGQIKKMVVNWKSYIVYPVFKAVSKGSNFKIYSVEYNPEFYQKAKAVFFSNPNIILENQSSEQFLRNLIDSGTINGNDNSFFFLDAHWGEYWPLRDELKQVLRLPRFVVAIDDFAVPGHPEFGYDTYQGIACDWEYIKDLFKDRNVSVYYPIKPNRNLRGWVLIVSGYPQENLAFLDTLPLSNGSSKVITSESKGRFRSLVLRSPILVRGARFLLMILAYFKR